MTPTPSEVDIQTALRSYLLTLLPPGVDCIEGQDNLVAEPAANDFVVMTPILRKRLGTNIDVWADTKLIGSISGSSLTVTQVTGSPILVGSTLWGASLPVGGVTLTGLNGDGTYALSGGPFTLSSRAFACGDIFVTQPTEVHIQLDFHSADVSDSSDMVQVVSTAFRSDYACMFFQGLGVKVTPLFAEDPRQVPFINAEQQWETRWTCDVALQCNQTIPLPVQFMDNVVITLATAD